MRKIKMIKLGIGMAALSAFMLSTTVSAQNINENDIADQTVEEKNAEDQTVVDDNAVAPHVVEKLNQMAANKDRYYVPFEDNVAPGVIARLHSLQRRFVVNIFAEYLGYVIRHRLVGRNIPFESRKFVSK